MASLAMFLNTSTPQEAYVMAVRSKFSCDFMAAFEFPFVSLVMIFSQDSGVQAPFSQQVPRPQRYHPAREKRSTS
jgi:hypothetical protein